MQEPGDNNKIAIFAKKQFYNGIILDKADVNGKNTRPLFKYLKKVTGKKSINWNFDGRFLCDRGGSCSLTDITTVEKEIISMLGISTDEL